MTAVMDTLLASDFIRLPTQAMTRPLPFKEWHHFVIQRDDVRLLVNFSMLVEQHLGSPRRIAPQVIVLFHGGSDAAAFDRTAPSEFSIAPDLRGLTIGGSRMVMNSDGYDVVLDLDRGRIAGELSFRPVSRPFVVNNQPVGAGRLSWLFVPQARVDGWVVADGARIELVDDVAYHDHNWGHFTWGDDFSWMWGSVLPADPDDYTLVVMQMTDRAGHRANSQAVYVWHGAEPVGMFRDRDVTITRSGPAPLEATTFVPPIVRMLSGRAHDVPAELTLTATTADDDLRIIFRPDRFTRVGFPDERSLDRICTLDEASGSVEIDGTVGQRAITRRARGFFELCHG